MSAASFNTSVCRETLMRQSRRWRATCSPSAPRCRVKNGSSSQFGWPVAQRQPLRSIRRTFPDMTAGDHSNRTRATPLQAGVILGAVAMGSSVVVTSNLTQAVLVGLISGGSVYAVGRRRSDRGR